MLVFMTDGLPTVDETNVTRIVDNVRKASRPGVRLFTFGVGYDVNTALLDKLAAENGGVADYVEPKEDLEVKVSNFFSKVNYPVLTDLQLDMGGAQTDLIYPRSIPDVFRGSQVTLIGRYSNEADLNSVQLKLTGKAGGSVADLHYTNLSFPLRTDANDYLPRLWATRRVGWLMEQVRSNGEQKELRDEIVDLGTRYGIVTPYTSYLALEDGSVSSQLCDRQPGRRAKSHGGGFGSLNAPSASASAGHVGDCECDRCGCCAAKQDAARAAGSDRLKDETAHGCSSNESQAKTFYLIDGVWTDSEFKAESRLPETVLVFGSDEYFALLKQNSKLGSYFSLGERVVVVIDGRVYRVNAPKP